MKSRAVSQQQATERGARLELELRDGRDFEGRMMQKARARRDGAAMVEKSPIREAEVKEVADLTERNQRSEEMRAADCGEQYSDTGRARTSRPTSRLTHEIHEAARARNCGCGTRTTSWPGAWPEENGAVRSS